MKAFYEPTSEHLAKLELPWCCSYSGGKDSTSLVTWIEWLRRVGWISVARPRLVQSDTGVEYEMLSSISQELMDLLKRTGWECAVVKPLIHERLYNRILGIGNTPIYPGIRNLRWCTRSTKIDPMERWRKENSGGLTLTGLRLGESKIRDGKLKRKGCSAGGECGIPDPSERTYSPLLQWTTYHVLDWLNGSVLDRNGKQMMADVFAVTKKLVGVYGCRIGQPSFAEFGEPELEMARFGCIGCPAIGANAEPPKSVVKRHGPNHPLNELYAVWFEARKRENRCWRWHPKAARTRNFGFGPIKMAARKALFERVQDIERRAGVTLITDEDEAFIRECWEKKIYPKGWSESDEKNPPPPDTPLLDVLKSRGP